MIEISDRAIELLGTAEAAARRFDPRARVRIVGEREGVRFELADGPGADDVVVEQGDVTIYVERHLAGTVDVEEPHDRLVLRPPTGREGW